MQHVLQELDFSAAPQRKVAYSLSQVVASILKGKVHQNHIHPRVVIASIFVHITINENRIKFQPAISFRKWQKIDKLQKQQFIFIKKKAKRLQCGPTRKIGNWSGKHNQKVPWSKAESTCNGLQICFRKKPDSRLLYNEA